jgi:hypothetical protein
VFNPAYLIDCWKGREMSSRNASTAGSRALLVVVAALVLVFVLGFGASVALAAGAGTLVDNGFESGTSGATLASPWTLSGTPTKAVYDNTRAKVGAKSGWIQNAATGSNGAAAAITPMTSNGSEVRFWIYLDNATATREVFDPNATTSARSFVFRFDNTGKITAYTGRTATGYTLNNYTQVGTYTGGTWIQCRIVNDFTTDTYTLSTRTDPSGAWTQLKASGAPDYNIPMRGTDNIASVSGVGFRGITASASMWVDELRYSDTGMTDATTGTVLDSGFESGTNGATLGAAWTMSGTPAKAVYDSTRSKVGTKSGWIQNAATGTHGVVGAFPAMSSDAAETRFWVYMDSTGATREIFDPNATTNSRSFVFRFDAYGKITAYTGRTATGYTTNGYTQVGTYTGGTWATRWPRAPTRSAPGRC